MVRCCVDDAFYKLNFKLILIMLLLESCKCHLQGVYEGPGCFTNLKEQIILMKIY